MNILHLQTDLNIVCGVTRNIYLIAKTTNDDYKHFVIGLGGDFVYTSKAKDVNIEIINYKRNSVFGNIQIISYLNKFCNQHQIDIVHSHHRYFDIISHLLSKLKKIQTITSVHNKVFGKKLFSYKSKNIIAVSNSVKTHLIKYFKIPVERIYVIHNFVDPDEVNIFTDKNVLKSQLKIKKNFFIIGYIGRLNFSEKGVDVLLRAFQILCKKYDEIVLVLVGEGENEEEIKKFVIENGLEVKMISGKENVYDYYNLLDVVVLPSRQEAFGIALIEAGILQKPVIGANIEAINDVINDDSGLLFEKENPSDLAKKIEIFYNDINLRNSCADNLFNKVNEKYSSAKIIPMYDKLYNAVFESSIDKIIKSGVSFNDK